MRRQLSRADRLLKYVNFGLLLMLGLDALLFIAYLFHDKNFAVFNAKGLIAGEQASLILASTAILLAIVVPTLALLYYFAWKYRETNQKATYDPDAKRGKSFIVSIWAIPSVFMLVLMAIMIPATHRLDPRQQISSDNETLTIQVVGMRWKWLFIYPEQNIATVNYVQIPTNTPVEFKLSADEAPMSSFWIPNLAGQMYAMTGHVNTLHVLADKPGDYPGSSAELTGAGFAGMKFVARASSAEEFDQWVSNTKSASRVLDRKEYDGLLKPSEYNKAVTYSTADPDLFSTMLVKYGGSHNHTETEDK